MHTPSRKDPRNYSLRKKRGQILRCGIIALGAAAVLLLIWRPWQSKPGQLASRSQNEDRPLLSGLADTGAAAVVAAEQPLTTKAPPLFGGPKDTSIARLIAELNDATLPLKARRQAARSLARLNSDEAIAALKIALRDGPAYLKAAVAEGLGASPHPEAREMLLELVNGQDETTARGALRGLALRADAEAVEVLSNVLFNGQKSDSVRTEAALALGDVDQPGAVS